MSDEWFEDEEYIDDTNDPQWVEKISKEEYTIPLADEKIDFDKVFETVRTQIADLTKHDHTMEEKILDALRMGKLK